MVELIEQFVPIHLEQMEEVALLKRTDTKFILPFSELGSILEKCAPYYRVLEIEEQRIMNYKTLYFDTPSFKFYSDHQRGKPNRKKVRIREYVDSKLLFLEVKHKNGKGETIKKRLPIKDYTSYTSDPIRRFIQLQLNHNHILRPVLWNSFQRFTLVSIEASERVTIDINITFTKEKSVYDMQKLVIIELKKEKYNRHSQMAHTLKAAGIRSTGFSKYCTGLGLAYPQIRSNMLKPKYLKINKINA